MERQESETSSAVLLTSKESSADTKDHVQHDAVTAWGKQGEIEPPSQNGHLKPNHKSDAESASVNDLGEAKRLQKNEEEIIQPSSNVSQDPLAGAGTQFAESSSELENKRTSLYVESVQDLVNDVSPSPSSPALSLASKLRAELKYSLAGKDGRKFLPRDKFDEILTISAVRQELETHAVFRNADDGELKRLTDKVYKASMTEPGNHSSATHRRKLFALLSLMQMVPAIKEFIAAGIHDNDLPFIMEENKASAEPFYCMYRWHDIRKPGSSESRIPISCFSKWQDHQIEGFSTNQWQLLAPHFELGSVNIKPYNFHDNIILPFTEDTSDNWKEGGFSDVWQVKIHRAHWHTSSQRAKPNNGDTDNPPYAIKRLRQDNRVAFDKEVEALKRFSDQNNLHLINLLLTFYYRGKYHLVFPWADGNLSSFWKEYRDTGSPRRDWIFVQWVARQWLGIAEGLQAIHKPPPRAETQDPNNPRDNGRHGDLKPENILWFKSGHRNLTDSAEFGVFVISDFGLTSFHRNETKDQVSPSHLARSPTYRPPECDVCKTISPSYDMWSFGCILLEFVIWYTHGWDGVDKALERRLEMERLSSSEANFTNFTEDKFFELIEKGILEDDNRIGKVARLKTCVKEEFSYLRKQGTPQFFHDLLEYVYENLLRMRPDKRATCEEIVAKFNDMYERCLTDQDYCTKIVHKTDRKGTNNSELNAFHRPAYKSVAPPKDGELDEPASQSPFKELTDSIGRPNLNDEDRQITESPQPWESRQGTDRISSRSSVKRDLDIPSSHPSPNPLPRTDSNSTGQGSPRKIVSWAKEPDTQRDPPLSPGASQLAAVHASKPTPRQGEGVSPQEQEQTGDQHNVKKTTSVSTPESSNEEGLDQVRLPSPTVQLSPVSKQGRDGHGTSTAQASERAAPIKAQKLLAPTNLPIPPISQPVPLLPPPQPTPRTSSNTDHQKPVANHTQNPPDLDGVSRSSLFLAFCKSLWCF